MTLPQIENGILRLDNSAHEAIQRCPRYAWHMLAHRRVSATRDPARAFGKALHAAWELRYKECGSRAVPKSIAEAQVELLERHFAGVELPDNEHRTLGRAKEVCAAYNATYGEEPYRVLATEVSRERELGTVRCIRPVISEHSKECVFCAGTGYIRIMWQGRADGILHYNNRPFVRDFKTMKELYDVEREADKYRVSGQFKGYCWLFSGDEFGTIRDAQIDAVVVRPPLARERNGTKPRTEFQRWHFRYTDASIEEWRRDVLEDVRVWLEQCASVQPPPMRRTACAWPTRCQYFDVCTCETEESRMAWLASSAYRDNGWDPMQGKDSNE